MRNLVIDLETSGFPKTTLPRDHEDQPRVVELGMIVRDGAEVMSEFGTLVKVPDGFEMPPGAFNTHGISTDMCRDFGIGPRAAVNLALMLIIRAEVLVAFNTEFDFEMLRVMAARVGAEAAMNEALERPAEFCAMKRSANHCKIPAKNGQGFKSPKLVEAIETLVDRDLLRRTLGHRPAHRGLGDACRAMLIYDEINRREEVKM